MKLAIVGSRTYPDLDAVYNYVASLPDDTIIISGGARGVDRTAESAAREFGLQVDIHPAQWGKYGKSAGYRRNADIVNACDELVAFWDGESKGTLHSIHTASDLGKRVTVYDVNMKVMADYSSE